jgi:hypothetical protein
VRRARRADLARVFSLAFVCFVASGAGCSSSATPASAAPASTAPASGAPPAGTPRSAALATGAATLTHGCAATLPSPDVLLAVQGDAVYLDRVEVTALDPLTHALPAGAINARGAATVITAALATRLDPPRVAGVRAPALMTLDALRPLLRALAAPEASGPSPSPGPGHAPGVDRFVVEAFVPAPAGAPASAESPAAPCPVVVTVSAGAHAADATPLSRFLDVCLHDAPAPCALDLTPPPETPPQR